MICNKVITNSQILEAYSIDDIVPKYRTSSYDSNPKCISDTHKDSLVYLTKDNDEILQHCCIHNEYIIMKNEKIVKLNNITIKDTLRRKKIVKNLLYKNKEVYKANGFKKIMFKAINDGVIVWKKLGFEFDNLTDEKIILKQFHIYLRTVKAITNKRYTKMEHILKTLFFDDDINFTDWLSSKKDANLQHFSMTLRISND